MLTTVFSVTVFFFPLQTFTSEVCRLGKRQSPIEIKSSEARYQSFPPLKLVGHDSLSLKAGTLYAKNANGSTVKLYSNTQGFKTNNVAVLTGGPLNTVYEFAEMHFHWGEYENFTYHGSEHSFEGSTYPLGLHLVHKNINDDTVEEAITHENGLAVLEFNFRITSDGIPEKDRKASRNEGLEHLAQIVKDHLTEPNSKFEAKDLKGKNLDVNVMNFVPIVLDEYFHYKGSLTTGTCDQAVNWIVFRNPLAIASNDYFYALKTIKGLDGKVVKKNFRPIQKTNGRPVYYHGEDLINAKVIKKGKNSMGAFGTGPPEHNYWLLPHCPGSPTPAPLWEVKRQRADKKVWESRHCKNGEGKGNNGEEKEKKEKVLVNDYMISLL